jgi:hypothetical protein
LKISFIQKSSNECNNILKSCISLSSSPLNHCSNCRRIQSYSHQLQYRRCLSLNNLTPCSFFEEKFYSSTSYIKKHLVRSQSLFGTTTDNEKAILKPLPFNHKIGKKILFGFFFLLINFFVLRTTR